MSASSPVLVQSYHPTTFVERGASVPFTTPMLMGARARPSDRNGFDLIVPSPSGGKGVYVLPWSGVTDLCRPTLHDERLNRAIAALRLVTPSSIRAAAREIAAEGLAGREAMEAARANREVEQQERLLTNFLLLLALVQQVEPTGENATPPEQDRPAMVEQRARRAIMRIAPRLKLSPEEVAASLEQLAGPFSAIGVGRHAGRSRAARMIAALTLLRDETARWAVDADPELGGMAEMVSKVAALTIECASATLAEARALVDSLPALLERWHRASEPLLRLVGRPDWLLDGWEQPCLLWQQATTEPARRQALAEIALMVPVIPREAGDWVGFAVDTDLSTRFRRSIQLGEDWRTGAAVLDLIARNEHLRALAA